MSEELLSRPLCGASDSSRPLCPSCGAGIVVVTNDFERDLLIFRCDKCGDMFAVSIYDAGQYGVGWVFNEWRRSLARQKKLCWRGVER